MTLTLNIPDDVQVRLTAQAARHGQTAADYLLTLAQDALSAEQEKAQPQAEPQIQSETIADLQRSVQQFAAGQWHTPEELDSLLAARRP